MHARAAADALWRLRAWHAQAPQIYESPARSGPARQSSRPRSATRRCFAGKYDDVVWYTLMQPRVENGLRQQPQDLRLGDDIGTAAAAHSLRTCIARPASAPGCATGRNWCSASSRSRAHFASTRCRRAGRARLHAGDAVLDQGDRLPSATTCFIRAPTCATVASILRHYLDIENGRLLARARPLQRQPRQARLSARGAGGVEGALGLHGRHQLR